MAGAPARGAADLPDYPRLLVIAPRPLDWEGGGGGVTMCNLLKGWPLDRIAQIHSDRQRLCGDPSICRHGFCFRASLGDEGGLPGGGPTECLWTLARYAMRRKESWGPLSSLLWLLPRVREFAPDVIYSYVLQAPAAYWTLPRRLAQALAVPYVTHMMDDWPALHDQHGGLLDRLFWRNVRRWSLRKLFHAASGNIGICPEMCEAFAERYGCSFVPFHNCVEVQRYDGVGKSYAAKADGAFDLVYIGSVRQLKELESLVDLKRAVLALAERVPGIRLTVHHPRFGEDISNFAEFLHAPPHVVSGDYLAPDELPRRLVEADALVVPLGFVGDTLTYLRYSFQTKVPEYLASGTPVLVYGPAASPNTLAARRDGWGLVVDRQEPSLLASALADLVDKEELRRALGTRGREVAGEFYDAKRVREEFRHFLASRMGLPGDSVDRDASGPDRGLGKR